MLTRHLCDRLRITAGPFESAACLEEEVAPHIPYGGTRFARIVGQLAGHHFLTITVGREHLGELGRIVL
jgi:hypothetical protein